MKRSPTGRAQESGLGRPKGSLRRVLALHIRTIETETMGIHVRRKTPRTNAAIALIGLVAFSSCVTSSSRKTDNLRAVDALVGRIERVYVEAEVSKERVEEAVSTLQALVAPDFAGDPVAAYEAFLFTIESSEKQAEVFSASVADMEQDATSVFESWESDLDTFQSVELRRRSAARLEATRARYAEIGAAVRPVQTGHAELNAGLRDQSVFLEHDFNREALLDLEPETASLSAHAEALDHALDRCMAQTRGYVESAAMPGQLEKPTEPGDSKPGG